MPPRFVRKVKTLVGLLRPQADGPSENEFWQGKAQENPLFNIATSRTDWTTEDFLRDGAWRVAKWVTPWLYKSGLDLTRARFVEIGCGAGRFAYSIAPHVGSYVGVDIVPEHLQMARTACHELSNASFVQVTGSDLAPIATASVDAVFSYAVFQHIYSKERILGYVDESLRVLRPGGTAKFQLVGTNCTPGLHVRWRRLADAPGLARVLGNVLPDDVLLPGVSFYRAGVGMRGMGVDAKELLQHVQGRCQAARIEDFEDESRASRYWLVLTK